MTPGLRPWRSSAQSPHCKKQSGTGHSKNLRRKLIAFVDTLSTGCDSLSDAVAILYRDQNRCVTRGNQATTWEESVVQSVFRPKSACLQLVPLLRVHRWYVLVAERGTAPIVSGNPFATDLKAGTGTEGTNSTSLASNTPEAWILSSFLPPPSFYRRMLFIVQVACWHMLISRK